MRVSAIGRLAPWLVFVGVLATAEAAAAQSFLYRPAAPSAGVSGVFDVRYQHVDLGATSLHGGQLAIEVEGRALVAAHLELGARWGLRGSAVVLDELGGRTRVGLPPLTIFVGTGGDVDRVIALGVRLLAGASFALVGVDDLSSNGEHAFAALEGALGATWSGLDLQARIALGLAYAGSTALSGIVRTDLGAEVGEKAWPLRPFLGATLAYATDIAFGGELLVGASARVEGAPLRFGVGITPWDDPSGNVVRLWLAADVPL